MVRKDYSRKVDNEGKEMTTEDTYRDANKRSHKLLGMYLALWAWRKDIDCVVLPRSRLLPYLGLQQMRNTRIDWLTEDVKDLFRYSWRTVTTPTEVYGTLYLSRKAIPSSAKEGSMTDDRRIELLKKAGLSAAIAAIPPEEQIVSVLALMAHGVGDFR